MIKLIIFLGSLAFTSADTIRVTFYNLTEIAQKYSPYLKEIKYNKGSSTSLFLGNLTNSMGGADFSITRTDITFQDPVISPLTTNYSSNLSLSVGIASPSNLIKAVNSIYDYKSSLNSYEDLKQQFLQNLKVQFLNTVKLKKTADAYEKAYERSKLYFNLINERYQLKMVSKVDYLRGEVDLKTAEINYLNAKNTYNKSLERLRNMLGIGDDKILMLEEYDPDTLPTLKYSDETLIELAQINNLQLKQFSSTLGLARTNLIASIISFVPQISFGKVWSYTGQDLPRSLNNYNEKEQWVFQAYINLLNYPFIVANRAQLERASFYKYRKTLYEIVEKIKSSYSDYTYYLKALELAQLRFEQAGIAFELASEQYKEGIISLLQLMDAETSLLQSEVGLIEAKYNYLMAIENIKYLTGMEVNQ